MILLLFTGGTVAHGTTRPMRVARIGLTAMKGTRHRTLGAVDLSSKGPVGDKVFCLVEREHRQVLRTVAHGLLLRATVAWDEGVLTVGLEGQVVAGVPVRTGETFEVDYWGRRIRADVVGGPWAKLFSHYLGYSVLLARTAPGDTVYGDQVSVITTASLAGLRLTSRQTPGCAMPLDIRRDGARFRSTFVIDTANSPYAESGSEVGWLGQDLLLGEARVHLYGSVVRCGVVDLHPVSGHRDVRLLDALPRNARGEPEFGLQGHVVQPGLVQSDAPVGIGGTGPSGASTPEGGA